MPWIDTPETGWIAGLRPSGDPAGNDTVEVRIKRKRFWPFGNTTHIRTDANGFFGLARVKPGRYEIAIGNSRRYVHVAAGNRVASRFLTSSFSSTWPPARGGGMR